MNSIQGKHEQWTQYKENMNSERNICKTWTVNTIYTKHEQWTQYLLNANNEPNQCVHEHRTQYMHTKTVNQYMRTQECFQCTRNTGKEFDIYDIIWNSQPVQHVGNVDSCLHSLQAKRENFQPVRKNRLHSNKQKSRETDSNQWPKDNSSNTTTVLRSTNWAIAGCV